MSLFTAVFEGVCAGRWAVPWVALVRSEAVHEAGQPTPGRLLAMQKAGMPGRNAQEEDLEWPPLPCSEDRFAFVDHVDADDGFTCEVVAGDGHALKEDSDEWCEVVVTCRRHLDYLRVAKSTCPQARGSQQERSFGRPARIRPCRRRQAQASRAENKGSSDESGDEAEQAEHVERAVVGSTVVDTGKPLADVRFARIDSRRGCLHGKSGARTELNAQDGQQLQREGGHDLRGPDPLQHCYYMTAFEASGGDAMYSLGRGARWSTADTLAEHATTSSTRRLRDGQTEATFLLEPTHVLDMEALASSHEFALRTRLYVVQGNKLKLFAVLATEPPKTVRGSQSTVTLDGCWIRVRASCNYVSVSCISVSRHIGIKVCVCVCVCVSVCVCVRVPLSHIHSRP